MLCHVVVVSDTADCEFAGSPVDTMETLPLEVEGVGELQSKPSTLQKVQNLPKLDPPCNLSQVLVDLEREPPQGLDPSAQHKKQFKDMVEKKKQKKPTNKGHIVSVSCTYGFAISYNHK